MRCFVRKIGNSYHYHAAFDWAGVSYTHSLHTRNEREAEVRIEPIRDTLYRLEQPGGPRGLLPWGSRRSVLALSRIRLLIS
jgi:hypothetical protein